jgi:hypothetical protein
MSATVHSFTEAKAARQVKAQGKPAWANDLRECCLAARVMRADHEAESARIALLQHQRGEKGGWWDGSKDIADRVDENNRLWWAYREMIQHIATLPATSRSEAVMKRTTIGKMWLRPSDRCDDRGWSPRLPP